MKLIHLFKFAVGFVVAGLLLTSCSSPAERYLKIRQRQTDPSNAAN